MDYTRRFRKIDNLHKKSLRAVNQLDYLIRDSIDNNVNHSFEIDKQFQIIKSIQDEISLKQKKNKVHIWYRSKRLKNH